VFQAAKALIANVPMQKVGISHIVPSIVLPCTC
jgi:hypothetical protein